MQTQGESRPSPKPTPGTNVTAGVRARWAPPRIVRHGSVRHLVRGISGFLADTFGMPGMRKV